jgi:hypothetical protein
MRRGLLAAALALLSSSFCAAEQGEQRLAHFVRRGAVVCLRRQDLMKVERAANRLRYFGQLRALVADGRCRLYSEREKIVEIGAVEQAERRAIVPIRTEEKPDVLRWISLRDIRNAKRNSRRR